MKKNILIMFALIFTLNVSAQKNDKEKGFLNRLKSYVASEGYVPTIDDDGDLTFKKEGELYWISVDEEPKGYFYVSFYHESLGCKSANIYSVRKAIDKVNSEYKVGKCYLSKDNSDIIIKTTGYYALSSDFTKYFERYISTLKDMHDDLSTYYEEFENN